MSHSMTLHLNVWRQKDSKNPGRFVKYALEGVSPEMSFLEMLDLLNENLLKKGEDPVAFDHDCREGICGMCSLVINGRPHGPDGATTTCQLHMRRFKNGESVTIEPFRARAFPPIKDLAVDRSAFDRVMAAGGFCAVNVGGAPEANGLLIPKEVAESAFRAASCIGCGACVAACKNASAMLFTSAKVSHLGQLPQGAAEADKRAINMVTAMDDNGFGNCTNEGECEAVCPKEISISNIARLNRDYLRASLLSEF